MPDNDDLGEAEWERLAAGPKARLEFENTTDYLDATLSESGRVLDVGGAAGRYAIWLAERGYEVVLADVNPRQRELARENPRARCRRCGDCRARRRVRPPLRC